MFVTTSTTVCHWTVPWSSVNHSTLPYIVFCKFHSNIIFPSTPRSPVYPFQVFRSKSCNHFSFFRPARPAQTILSIFVIFSYCMSCPSHSINISLSMHDMNFSLLQFLHYSIISALFSIYAISFWVTNQSREYFTAQAPSENVPILRALQTVNSKINFSRKCYCILSTKII